MKRCFAVLLLCSLAIAGSACACAEGAQGTDTALTDSAMNVMTEIYSIDPDIAKTFRYEIVSAKDPATVNVYPFEDMDDPFVIVYGADGYPSQIEIPDILNFTTLGGKEFYFDFWSMDDAQRAEYSKEYIPKVEALLRIDPDFYEDEFPSSIAEKARWHYDTTRRVYGIPQEGDLTKEEGYEKAVQALQTQLNVTLTPEGDEKVNYVDSLFDVTDPDRRFWQYNIDLIGEENPSKGGYYIVSIDAQTGEVVEAFEFEDDMPTAMYY